MNDNIGFRFVTRTLSEDFKVFYYDHGVIKQLDDNAEFAPLRSKGDIIPEEGPCAVIFEENNKIFLTVSSLSRRTDDRAGRPIRFSFCRIYQNAKEDYGRALGAFTKIISNWEAAEDMIDEKRQPPLLRIIPITRTIKFDDFEKNMPGEDVEFDEDKFISWLESEPFSGQLKQCSNGRWTLAEVRNNKLIPGKKFIFKWTKSANFIECTKSAGESNNMNPSAERSSRSEFYNFSDVFEETRKIYHGVKHGVKAFVQETARSTGTSGSNSMLDDRDNLLKTINSMFNKYSSFMSIEQQQAFFDASRAIAFAFTPHQNFSVKG